ncbi:MAG: hypothetical protein FWC42_02015 [Proteobacteria bacterium]|nr:hypothetical protein [Pseudomonadota bacterium]
MRYSFSSNSANIDTTFDSGATMLDWRGRDVVLALMIGGVLGVALFSLLLPLGGSNDGVKKGGATIFTGFFISTCWQKSICN